VIGSHRPLTRIPAPARRAETSVIANRRTPSAPKSTSTSRCVALIAGAPI
jgi:hypothetical protein